MNTCHRFYSTLTNVVASDIGRLIPKTFEECVFA